MSKRATKKAAKWVPKVGDRVRMTGKVTAVWSKLDACDVKFENETTWHYVASSALRPAVELFAWKPEKKHTTKGAKKK